MIDIAPTDERDGLPSASSMERIALCPGSVNASRGLAEIKTPEMQAMGESGDRIHLWLEAPGFIDLVDEERERAEEIASQRNALIAEQGFMGGKEMAEQRLWLTEKGKRRYSARLDYNITLGKRSLVVEYKSGYGDQTESARNLQLRSQAVVLEWNQQAKNKSDEIVVAVIQPLVSSKPDVAVYTSSDIASARSQIRRFLDASEQPDAPRVPGKKQCQFCNAKLKCPEAQKVVGSLDTEALIGVTPEQLSVLLDRCDVAAGIIDATRAQAKALLAINPDAIPNWKLGKPGNMRVVPEPFKLYEALYANELIDKDSFIKSCKVGIGDLEKTIYAYLKAADRKKTKKEIDEALAAFPDLIVKKPKQPSIERI